MDASKSPIIDTGRAAATPSPAPSPAQLPAIRSAGITLLGSVVGGGLIVSSEFLLARYLGVQSYGLYASGITVARVGEALAVYGLPVAIFHFLPVYRHRSQREETIGTVYAAGLLPLAIGCAFALIVWLLAPVLARHVFGAEAATPFIRVLAAAAPFMAATEVLGAITRGYGHAKYYVIVKNLAAPVAFLALLAAIVSSGAVAIRVPEALLAASAVACTAGVLAVVRVAGADLWRVAPKFGFGTLYRYASGIMMNSLLYMVFAMTGAFAVAIFLGTDSVGIYRVCLQVVIPFDMVLLAFHAAMGPIYPVLLREKRGAELEDAYAFALRWMAMLLLPIGIALVWNRHDLLGLLGPGFTAGSTAVTILAAGYASATCFGTVAYLLMLGDHKALEVRNALIAVAMNLVLCALLVPRLGLAGAALATAASFVLLNLRRIRQARTVFGLKTFRPYLMRLIAVSIVGGFGALALLEWLGIAQGRRAGDIALRLLLMALLHISLLWAFGLDRHDKHVLWSLAGRLGAGRA
ncbi:hypothetical protein BH11PSE9_BH11PSE9_20460 [soil metagenome]